MTVNGFVIRRSTTIKSNEIVESKDAIIKFNRMLKDGSQMLAKALLDSGRLHGPMTMKQQVELIEYADNVQVVYVA